MRDTAHRTFCPKPFPAVPRYCQNIVHINSDRNPLNPISFEKHLMRQRSAL